ncbi:MAG TPA: non-canonical purine NTP pyrophosphatase [Patescibacteria group bacterium]|nr:non-canonical purine NTP pyrophosphatase [Patescibacteria group bacterium]
MLLFVTTNDLKFSIAKKSLANTGIEISQKKQELEELQSDDPKIIVSRKAQHAFELFKTPLIVQDDSWEYPALNGFPGPYAHYINDHLTAQDLIRLMDGKKDRTVRLHKHVCYIDQSMEKIFTEIVQGIILEKPEGEGVPTIQIASTSSDGHSIAYHINHGGSPKDWSERPMWNEFADWYINRQ